MTRQSRKRKRTRIEAAILVVLLAALGCMVGCAIHFPGKSFDGELPAINPDQHAVKIDLQRVVTELAAFDQRHSRNPVQLNAAADYVEGAFTDMGYTVERQTYDVGGVASHNLVVEIAGTGKPDEIYIFGAHYDAVPSCPGANDNASGVAALLSIARHFQGRKPVHTVRFVAFTNEEPPHFRTESMGSRVYANRCKERNEKVVAMFSLETMGYFSDEPNSQQYPPVVDWLYPSTGDFIGFVGNSKSKALARQTVKLFREHVQFPSEAAALPESMTGVGFSDHESFWRAGYPGLMITDTAFFRYAYYHTAQDTPDKLNFEHLARVVEGLQRVFASMTQAD